MKRNLPINLNPESMQNLKEFKELILRYESITIKEIVRFHKNGEGLSSLTGFGKPETCTLCLAVNDHCFNCVYAVNFGCLRDESYHDITDASIRRNVYSLLRAYKNRAEYMRNKLIDLNLNFDEL
jgi:hypothetical protein